MSAHWPDRLKRLLEGGVEVARGEQVRNGVDIRMGWSVGGEWRNDLADQVANYACSDAERKVGDLERVVDVLGGFGSTDEFGSDDTSRILDCSSGVQRGLGAHTDMILLVAANRGVVRRGSTGAQLVDQGGGAVLGDNVARFEAALDREKRWEVVPLESSTHPPAHTLLAEPFRPGADVDPTGPTDRDHTRGRPMG